MRSIPRLSWVLGMILVLGSPVGVQAASAHDSLLPLIARGEVRPPRFLTRTRMAPPAEGVVPWEMAPRPLVGNLRVLAVCVDFSDKPHTVGASFFDGLIFTNQHSVKGYFQEISYGRVNILTNNTPSSLGWQRAPQTLAYYTNGQYGSDGPYPHNCQKLAEDVVDALAGTVNFAPYDVNHDGRAEPIIIIHAGRGAEKSGNVNDIWSHAGVLAYPRNYNGVIIDSYITVPEYMFTVGPADSDLNVGIFAHEMGHGFWGLPDLYDTDYTSQGLGNWSLMSFGQWNGPNRLGEWPAWPDAWCRIQMGLINPVTVDCSEELGCPIPIYQAYNNPSTPTVYQMVSSGLPPGEFWLFENRQQVQGSYDSYLPGSGLLLYHIDSTMPDNCKECLMPPKYFDWDDPYFCPPGWHYKVRLHQADRSYHLEYNVNAGDPGDAFPNNAAPVGLANSFWCDLSGCPSYGTYDRTYPGFGLCDISASGPIMTANATGTGIWGTGSLVPQVVLNLLLGE